MFALSLRVSLFSVTAFLLPSLIRISDALDILVRHNRINSDMAKEVIDFLRSNPAEIPLVKREPDNRTSKINEVCQAMSGVSALLLSYDPLCQTVTLNVFSITVLVCPKRCMAYIDSKWRLCIQTTNFTFYVCC